MMDLGQILLDLEAQSRKNAETIKQTKTAINDICSMRLLPSHLISACNKDFENLKILMESNYWPSEYTSSMDINLAAYVLDTFLPPLAGKKFLDFCCGEGHIVKKALEQKPESIVAYDTRNCQWQCDNIICTKDLEVVSNNGPYDVVLLYDVIDHAEDVKQTLLTIKKMLKPEGKAYIHCHPWTARQGQHLNTNKAYVHLVFLEEEIAEMGLVGFPTNRLIHPLPEYERWFREAGFKIHQRSDTTNNNVEPFFIDTPLVARRIKRSWAGSYDENLRNGFHFPPIHVQTVDYVLI